jgi:aspartate/methionine/tyrosine aminotransferase
VKDSWDFAFTLMHRTHLAITPGRDFGQAETARYVRFSTDNAMNQLEESIFRLGKLLK